MKLNNVKDINKFFEVVEKCNGKIELVTGEGDRLNLKSNLCKYVAFVDIMKGAEIPEMEIVCYDPSDTMRMIEFMMEG